MAAAGELVSGRLFLLGGVANVNSDISWLPPGQRGHEALNAYLLLEGNRALLIDTGVAAHESSVIGVLSHMLADDAELDVLLTRIEADCIGNLGAVMSRFNVRHIWAGGLANPFDFFEDAARIDADGNGRTILERKELGEPIQLGAGRSIEVLRPKLRLLATSWAYDQATGTLFTSDSFGHVAPRNLKSRTTSRHVGLPDLPGFRLNLLSKFDWLEGADVSAIRADLTEIFASRAILRLAPSHGRVIEGAKCVQSHYQALLRILESL